MKVAAFTKYDREAASTRQRVLQYLPHLAAAGIEVEVFPLLDDAYVRALESDDPPSKSAIAAGYLRRFRQLLGPMNVDLIWIYAELFPWLPATAERLVFRTAKPVVYDYDDAFFQPYDDHPNRLVRGVLAGKLRPLIDGAAKVCAGNEYLRDYGIRAGGKAIVLPTVVDTDVYRPAALRRDRPVTIGWIGSPSTWQFVRPLLPLLADLSRERRIAFSVIGAGTAADADVFEGMELTSWAECTEVASVQAMDIGIMPLPDDPWTRGKSGYKLVQYMACGLPTVASPVGANSAIVLDEVTGLLASDLGQWRTALIRLIDNPHLRATMGEAGRARAVAAYSLQAHAPRLINVMLDAAGARTFR